MTVHTISSSSPSALPFVFHLPYILSRTYNYLQQDDSIIESDVLPFCFDLWIQFGVCSKILIVLLETVCRFYSEYDKIARNGYGQYGTN